ncbi:MAG: oxaloacetate decarboxylase subunit gamma [Lentisphaerae bacterium]|jgi:oxaloacetate decarboxylase gamma subunit|nr:oxaloacetate decarboxylase subunit gamma [Lentisphaerota bacterium]
MEANALILEQGLVLLAAGMAIVFAFLYVLVLVVRLTARIVPRFNHILPDATPKVPTRPAAAAAIVTDHSVVAAVIAAAARR